GGAGAAPAASLIFPSHSPAASLRSPALIDRSFDCWRACGGSRSPLTHAIVGHSGSANHRRHPDATRTPPDVPLRVARARVTAGALYATVMAMGPATGGEPRHGGWGGGDVRGAAAPLPPAGGALAGGAGRARPPER